ncbi:MAG: ABC transporter permease [Calditrichaeota bacterium]|nr:MAG: ABC transporter permease [Calditrichota bacterium]
MIVFLLKGLLRDRSRSLFPTLTVMAGAALTVLMYCWVRGTEMDIIHANARFNTGHLKIMSRAYAEQSDQVPNDLAYIGVDSLMASLSQEFSSVIWTPRIRFGGLLDIPDAFGETRAQSPVAGLGVDLLSENSPEQEIFNLNEAIIQGNLPENPGEILISEELARRLKIRIGETATLISSTMFGSLTTYNFKVAGTIRFGISAMDRGAVLADLADVQYALNMEDATGEIVGFFRDQQYIQESADRIATEFNDQYSDNPDEFAPEMFTLRQQSGLGQILDYTTYLSGILIGIFIIVMSIVLWNAGLMASLRRYGEIGIRLAIGENKNHLYLSMIAESLIIGLVGSILGTAIGLGISYYLQVKGLDISAMLKNASMIISDVLRAQITTESFVIGFIPGLCATLLGTSLAGIGIYKRQTSQLTKEFEG